MKIIYIKRKLHSCFSLREIGVSAALLIGFLICLLFKKVAIVGVVALVGLLSVFFVERVVSSVSPISVSVRKYCFVFSAAGWGVGRFLDENPCERLAGNGVFLGVDGGGFVWKLREAKQSYVGDKKPALCFTFVREVFVLLSVFACALYNFYPFFRLMSISPLLPVSLVDVLTNSRRILQRKNMVFYGGNFYYVPVFVVLMEGCERLLFDSKYSNAGNDFAFLCVALLSALVAAMQIVGSRVDISSLFLSQVKMPDSLGR